MRLQKIYGVRELNGFTLIEVAVVTALVAVVGLISLNVGTESLPRFFFHADADIFGSSLLSVRSAAINAIDGVDHGIYIEADRYTVFSGSAYNPLDDRNEVFDLFPGVFFSDSGEVVFEKSSGAVIAPQTFTLNSGVLSADFVINNEGGIEW